jgi:DNA-binding GntR family transcriptional regulator
MTLSVPTHDTSELPSSTALLQQVLLEHARPSGPELGAEFTETELSRAAGMSTETVRDFLISFSHHGLLERLSGDRWRLRALDPEYAEELLETLETFELRALEQLARLPSGDPAFERLGKLLARHEAAAAQAEEHTAQFHVLEREFHACLIGLLNNRFVAHLIDVVAMVFHCRGQGDEGRGQATDRAARQEQVSILRAVVARDMPTAMGALRTHLHTQRLALLEALQSGNQRAQACFL